MIRVCGPYINPGSTLHCHYLSPTVKKTITMKTAAVFVLALVCVFGVALGQFGFGAQPAASSGFGSGGLLALLGLLLIFTLFTNSSSTGTGSTTIVYGNFSG